MAGLSYILSESRSYCKLCHVCSDLYVEMCPSSQDDGIKQNTMLLNLKGIIASDAVIRPVGVTTIRPYIITYLIFIPVRPNVYGLPQQFLWLLLHARPLPVPTLPS